MILYNVTVNINPEINQEWITWMKEEHIPKVMKTGCFIESKMFRMLSTEPDEGFTYSIQYLCENYETFEKYNSSYAPLLQREHSEKYKDQFVAFRSLLEKI